MRVVLCLTILVAFLVHSKGASELSEGSNFEELDACAPLNTSCEDCVAGATGVKCYICGDECRDVSGLTSDLCSLEDMKLGQCVLTGLALVIAISAGAFLVAVAGCVLFSASLYCYCRFCRKRGRHTGTQTRVDAEMSEMQERHSQRRSERTARGDELRRKYGLADEDDMSKYRRL